MCVQKTVSNSKKFKSLLAVYEHKIAINLSKKGVDIAFFNVIPEIWII